MSREARTLLIIGAMAVFGVVALGYMAQRYGRLLQEGTGARSNGRPVSRVLSAEEVPAQVEAFIAVREAMRLAIDARPDDPPDAEWLERIRDTALESAGLDPERYATLRAGYRRWLRGRLSDSVLGGAFEVRRARLERAALGRYEPLDL